MGIGSSDIDTLLYGLVGEEGRKEGSETIGHETKDEDTIV